jgi:hypothetical protein
VKWYINNNKKKIYIYTYRYMYLYIRRYQPPAASRRSSWNVGKKSEMWENVGKMWELYFITEIWNRKKQQVITFLKRNKHKEEMKWGFNIWHFLLLFWEVHYLLGIILKLGNNQFRNWLYGNNGVNSFLNRFFSSDQPLLTMEKILSFKKLFLDITSTVWQLFSPYSLTFQKVQKTYSFNR